ncbi:DNA-directed RNA polymerase subunit alpha [bacterium]|nr:DNA-directed RNA polymerase subunit alpha [bacterium]MBT3903971.1 DNA-directed RNA polymerase subunit alpha [bacterium]MBT4577789.1 DNA-directed RNA polymerase subunit alpha [bacterium]MBT5346088.1 DNA-directed RNA polymerase subunit alpha [bacterium]MBT6131357.1 DNA-directed RNA polymerase subunit alpha [bacterium]
MDGKEYQSLTIARVGWKKSSLTATKGELVAQPLEPGFGTTFGNALRRVLLGGVEGAAVTSVIIKGINNEFSTLPGVVEDSLHITLNIKGIVVKSKDGKPGKMHLKSNKAGAVTVADIVADDNIELINLEHVIANLADDGVLDVEFFVEPGRGYQPAKWPEDKKLQDDDRVYLDAMFSPVRQVAWHTEKARVGGKIDYDKLLLTVETDGSVSPIDVVHYAVSVIRTQMEHFLVDDEIPFNEISHKPEDLDVAKDANQEVLLPSGISVDLLLKPIDEMELSVRAHNCLINADIKRIVDLVNLDEEQGLNIKNFGKKSLGEVKESMKNLGLTFGMNIPEEALHAALAAKSKAE